MSVISLEAQRLARECSGMGSAQELFLLTR